MKSLVIGDSHLKIGILDDARSFIDQLLQRVESGSYDQVILLGDQFDTFAVVRSEILSLWTRFFQAASRHSKVIAIVGNHDLSGADGGSNPMEAFKAYQNVIIVDRPTELGNFTFLPFYRDKDQFEAECRKVAPGRVLFVHQSFNGATFENGFFDPHGADTEAVSHLHLVISGHIHKAQRVGNIWYPGTPFQHTFGDAGEDKYVFDIDEQGACIAKHALDMPRYFNIKADTLAELEEEVSRVLSGTSSEALNKANIKLIASGAPSEISAFWASEPASKIKRAVRRLVDGFSSTKPSTAFANIKGNSLQERFHEFVISRAWRTDPAKLAERAAGLLWSGSVSD